MDMAAGAGCDGADVGSEGSTILAAQPFNKGASCWMERNCFISIAKLNVGPLGRNIDWIDAKASMHLVDTCKLKTRYAILYYR
jgi:hypothetical protein